MLGSGGWVRTSDLIVTRSHLFRVCVDYLIIRFTKRSRALTSEYRWAHALVSEPSKILYPNLGLAADCHIHVKWT